MKAYWKRTGVILGALCVFLITSVCFAEEAKQPEARKWGGLQGAPVNTAISGGVVLPAGHAITAYNLSYRNKTSWKKGDDRRAHVDTLQVVNLLKLRYGVTDNWEISAVPSYIVLDPDKGDSLNSFGDLAIGTSYSFMLQRQGDPVSLSASAGLSLPTGEVGTDHLPGNGAWGGRLALGLTKAFGLHKIDCDLIGTVPFTDGNRNVTKGETLTFTYTYKYALSARFDAGIEGVVEHAWNGERNDISVNNHYTEWFMGPALTMAVPEMSGWVGIGAFFPVYRDYGQDTAVENYRIDFKLAFFW